ncbi:MAG: phosphatase PAP2 family protein [Ruminococcaceae bacterium]|nr:phosphatase PAP2 family protein [Oscillospiraceae bacterium]
MEVLKFFENLRTPFFNQFFSIITHLGEETFFIAIGMFYYWCINKRKGYFILSVGFLGTLANQVLKLFFRIPRPWVKDKGFTIVESARAEATGYSFPSGHTQSGVGVLGGITVLEKKLWVKFICVVFAILVPISRLYLGVHTLLDVAVSFFLAGILIAILYPVIFKLTETKKGMRIFFTGLTLIALGCILFGEFYNFPGDVDVTNYENSLKTIYKISGCVLGLWLSYELDEKYLHFDTKASWWLQIVKLVIGFALVMGVKSGLKPVLALVFGNLALANGIRYFIVTVFGGFVCPLIFKFILDVVKRGGKNGEE